MEQVLRLLTQQTPRLHSDCVFKSPGTQPPTQPASWLPEWPPQTPRVTRAKHSSTGLKIVGGGGGGACGCSTPHLLKGRGDSSIPTLHHAMHTPYPSSLHTSFPSLPLSFFSPCHPKPNAPPPLTLPGSWGGGWGVIPGPQHWQTISGAKRFLVMSQRVY